MFCITCVDGETPQHQGVGEEVSRGLQPAAEEMGKGRRDDATLQTIFAPQKSERSQRKQHSQATQDNCKRRHTHLYMTFYKVKFLTTSIPAFRPLGVVFPNQREAGLMRGRAAAPACSEEPRQKVEPAWGGTALLLPPPQS